MKNLTPKQMLAVFREVVEESSRLHAPGRKKAAKSRPVTKTKRPAKQTRKTRAAAE
jgi:hypothetical protein